MRVSAYGEKGTSIIDRAIAWVRTYTVIKLISKGSKMLDLGCGYHGELLNILKDRISVGSGLDLSVDKSQPHLQKGRVDATLPLSDSTFDIVTALAIIEHVDNPSIMLLESHRVLKNEGKIIITTPSHYGKIPLEIMASIGVISKAEINDHKRYYTKHTLAKELQDCGFKNVSVRHFGILWLNLIALGTK